MELEKQLSLESLIKLPLLTPEVLCLITNHLTDSGLLYGVVGAGALAAAMSSSDAITHGASVSFGRDICKAVNPKITESTELWIMRAAVFGVGFISYFIW